MAWIVLNYVEPGYTFGGCTNYPEEPSKELLGSFRIMMVYICFTPVVFINLIRPFAQFKFLRLAALLIPILPLIIGLQMSIMPYFKYGGRVYLYVAITAFITMGIIIWNAKTVSSKLSSR
ncbi:MAG: hypothetical protein GQ574_24235 [Crocinitomix sp.]|nr:hypothetical protein [Crocinitomix sp.]